MYRYQVRDGYTYTIDEKTILEPGAVFARDLPITDHRMELLSEGEMTKDPVDALREIEPEKTAEVAPQAPVLEPVQQPAPEAIAQPLDAAPLPQPV